MSASKVSLTSFDSSAAFSAHGNNFFLVTDKSGKVGVFDPQKDKLIVPCEFQSVNSTKLQSQWVVTEFGRIEEESFGSVGVMGLYDSLFQKIIIPTICNWVSVYNNEVVLIGIPSEKYFRSWKIGIYLRTKKRLLIDTTYEKDWIPQLINVKMVHKPIPMATRVNCVKITYYPRKKILVFMTPGGVVIMGIDDMKMVFEYTFD